MITEVLLSSSHVLLTKEGHLDAAVHVMANVGQRYNSRLMYDSLYPEIDYSVFQKCGWSEFYWDAKEAIPMNASEPRGKEVYIHMFVDSDHAGDKSILQIKKWLLNICEHC